MLRPCSEYVVDGATRLGSGLIGGEPASGASCLLRCCAISRGTRPAAADRATTFGKVAPAALTPATLLQGMPAPARATARSRAAPHPHAVGQPAGYRPEVHPASDRRAARWRGSRSA